MNQSADSLNSMKNHLVIQQPLQTSHRDQPNGLPRIASTRTSLFASVPAFYSTSYSTSYSASHSASGTSSVFGVAGLGMLLLLLLAIPNAQAQVDQSQVVDNLMSALANSPVVPDRARNTVPKSVIEAVQLPVQATPSTAAKTAQSANTAQSTTSAQTTQTDQAAQANATAQAQAAAARAAAAEKRKTDKTVALNFEGVEIESLVELLTDMTGRLFVMDEAVIGKVSLVSKEMVSVDEFYGLVVSLLESKGFQVTDKANGVFVTKAAPNSINPGQFSGPDSDLPAAGTVTKLFKLTNIQPTDLLPVLESIVPNGKQGAVSAIEQGRLLVVVGTSDLLATVSKMVAEIDKPSSSGNIEIIELKHASASSLAQQLSQALQASQTAGSKFANQLASRTGGLSKPGVATVIPVAQVNSVIIVGALAQITQAKELIKTLDQEGSGGRGNLHAIFLNYLRAEETAKNLSALLEKTATKDRTIPISIQPDIANNALLINADQVDFGYIQALVKELDIRQKQVLVEILIAEVTQDDNFDLGVELGTIESASDDSTTVLGRSRPGNTDQARSLALDSTFVQGMTFALTKGVLDGPDGQNIPLIPFLLRALSSDRNVEILSHVPLWAQNNTEASVSVVEDIPILRSTISGGTGDGRDVIQNIEREEVGIKFTVTPLVTPDNEVTLNLEPSIEAITDEGPPDAQFAPTIARRKVKNTMTIPDGHTVIISGLKRVDNIDVENRVPILGDIPILGLLFRSTTKTKLRTNLLIFVTPHVVTDPLTEENLQRRWEERTGIRPDADPTARPIWPDAFDKGLEEPIPAGTLP